MSTYVIRNGKLIEKHLAPPLVEIHGTAPYVISDSMGATRHMADGRYYDSKRQFREVTKAHGCVEVGTDAVMMKPRPPVMLDKRKRREDIKKAVHQVRNGRKV